VFACIPVASADCLLTHCCCYLSTGVGRATSLSTSAGCFPLFWARYVPECTLLRHRRSGERTAACLLSCHPACPRLETLQHQRHRTNVKSHFRVHLSVFLVSYRRLILTDIVLTVYHTKLVVCTRKCRLCSTDHCKLLA